MLWITSGLLATAFCEQVEGFISKRNGTASLFYQRRFHSSIVAGNYLYIDGGEIGTWDGTSDPLILPDNYTYAIDLSSPWNNKTVVLHQISKGSAPVLNQQALWLEPSGNTFYAYDGGLSNTYTGGGSVALPIWELPQPPDNALWQFSPSSTGSSGEWTQVLITPATIFSSLSRTIAGTYGSGGSLGFAIGGHENGFTDGTWRAGGIATYNTPDMVVYNMSSQEWYNVSTKAISSYKTAVYGAAQFVPSFSPAGLLFTLGGESTSGSIITWPNALPHQLFPMNNLSIYEPLSQTWLSQTTSGDIPPGVLSPCVVGLEGDEDTYEIFLYGGNSSVDSTLEYTVAKGVVYVLSLPSFHWTKQDYTPTTGRSSHTCNVAGNSQMIVVGGQVANDTSMSIPDPWPQGIGVFDLSAMEWSDSYDPSDPAYVTPKTIKNYIKANGRYPSSWDHPTLEAWFNSTRNATKLDNSHNSSDTGAIAGGVVGGVVGIALLAAFVYFILRRRRTQSGHNESLEPKRIELETESRTQELDDFSRPVELVDGSRHELEGGWQGHEFQS